ncbi:MAG: Tol-Pal system protein TolB [Alphaproteobacteria bacterium]|nr:Tol-Pal system protein TolB [Alphaproteobacteria bacterium]MBU6472655.1 Tol-Pal system protein TolB [Alphaproteobacteria bacterium]MDE2014144.1 Tol-Pal system protein TolB [Alphaproteobacteria bacterium]MDE2073705.1 Tol-Pal system protein TolB [Alphaproteobacteria bacterium]MDE2352524.1 Tol-Pal system protein TolB [Alphaproteobacteria bacterium]
MKTFALACAAAVAILLGAVAPAAAQLHVDVTQGNIQPLPIAIPDFVGTQPSDAAAAANIASVVRADLERSGLFKPLDPKSFIDQIKSIDSPPQFQDWRIINAQALVTGQVAIQPDGRLRVDFRLWDVYGQTQMLGLQYFTTPEVWRRVAHIISDAIYQRITGEKGYFDTRIVFISETGPALHRVKRLAVMDEDGANPIFLTNGSYMVLTPRFNPTAQMIAYMSYYGNRPRVYLFDLETGRQQMLGNFPNMTFSPRFSPDGNKVIMSLEKDGNSDIYVMDLRNHALTRLTYNPAIDTSPCFSPDGKQITFESDRGGSQQVYVMNADGSDAHRISFGAGRAGTPVWSPRGDLIAFTKIAGGAFRVAVMHPDGSGERVITDGWQDEGPTWAPNGRVLMFTRTLRNGKGDQIWSVDVTGRNERRVVTPGNASDPAWSPLIQ